MLSQLAIWVKASVVFYRWLSESGSYSRAVRAQGRARSDLRNDVDVNFVVSWLVWVRQGIVKRKIWCDIYRKEGV